MQEERIIGSSIIRYMKLRYFSGSVLMVGVFSGFAATCGLPLPLIVFGSVGSLVFFNILFLYYKKKCCDPKIYNQAFINMTMASAIGAILLLGFKSFVIDYPLAAFLLWFLISMEAVRALAGDSKLFPQIRKRV